MGAGTSWHLHHQPLISENSLGINRNSSPTSINKNPLGINKNTSTNPQSPAGFVAPGARDGTKSQPAQPLPVPTFQRENEEILEKKIHFNYSCFLAHFLGSLLRILWDEGSCRNAVIPNIPKQKGIVHCYDPSSSSSWDSFFPSSFSFPSVSLSW